MPRKMKIPTVRQLPSGNYFCQLRIDGRSISITDPDEDVVVAKAYAYKAGLLKAKRQPEDLTLREACDKYIDSRRSRLSPSTIQGYEKIVSGRFQGIMDKHISRLTNQMLDEAVADECYVTTYKSMLVSAKTVKNAYNFIRTVLRKYAPDLNTDVDLPEVHRKVTVLPDADDIVRAIMGTSVELPCLLAIWLSFTMSEIRGLTKSKSIQGDYIVITETVVRIDGKDVRKETGKEPSRLRKCKLPDYLRGLIDNVEGDILVPDSPDAITKRFQRIMARNGLPRIPFHMLRHVNVSLMSELQIPKAVARIRGGYSNDSVMESVYDNAFNSSISEAEKRLDERLNRVLVANKNANDV